MSRPMTLARPVRGLVAAAFLANSFAAGATFFVPDLLTGPAVTNGSARGTALVMLLIGLPVLAIATALAQRGSWRGLVVMIGVLAYFAYNDFLFLFATPYNSLFLIYVAAMSFTAFALGAAILTSDPAAVAERCTRVPARAIAVYAWVVAGLNTLLWLRTIVPASLAIDPTAFLNGSGVATNPVFVQDLVFWLPSTAIIGWLLWERRPLGFMLGGAWLVYGLIESIGVATDQWFGTTADPTSPHAGMAAVWLFVVLAVVGLVPLYLFFRESATSNVPAASAVRSGAG